MSDFLPVSHFQQSAEGYCLSACVRMVLAYLGIERTESEVSQVLGAQEFGTPSFAIQRLAEPGLQVIYREWSVSELLSALAAKQPVIVFVRTGFLDYWQEDFAHAVVIVGAIQISNSGFTILPGQQDRSSYRGTAYSQRGPSLATVVLSYFSS